MWSTPLKFMGFFHIVGYIVEIAFLVCFGLLGKQYRDRSEEDKRKVLLYVEICLVIMEVFKQIFLTVTSGSYLWEKFPLQICSIPMFLLLIFLLVKNQTIKNACLGFAGVPTILFGFFYFIKATAALETPYIIMSLQSFAWHWVISGAAVFIVVAYGVMDKGGFRKFIIPGYCIWSVFACIAAIVDALTFSHNPAINFFYIGYGQKPFYPIITLLFKSSKPYLPYFLFFFVYIGIGVVAMYGVCYLVGMLFKKVKKA